MPPQLQLSIAAKVLLGIAVVCGGLTLGLGQARSAQASGRLHSKWLARRGASVHAGVGLAAAVVVYSAALAAFILKVEPRELSLALLVAAWVIAMVGLRALVDAGEERGWVWTIRSGELVRRRLTLAIAAAAVLTGTWMAWALM